MRHLFQALLASILILAASPALAQRTDVIVLWNGNTITGEVKAMQQGKLKFKTDHAGTIYVKWEFVHSVTSTTFFEVENQQGDFFYGTFAATDVERKLVVVGPTETVTLDMEQVVEILPIKKTFWGRVDGSLDIGASYTSADSILQYSLESDATYRERRYSVAIALSSIQTRQEGRDDVFRDSLRFTYTRYFDNRYFGSGTLGFSRSSEQNLDLRTQIGGLYGRNFVQTNRSKFAAAAGLNVSRDTPIGGQPSERYLSAAFAAEYHFFLYNFPKTDILVDVTVLPGITDWPRVRVDFNGSIRREIVKDFTVNFSIFDNYDSNPVTEGAANHDFGVILSVGYTF